MTNLDLGSMLDKYTTGTDHAENVIGGDRLAKDAGDKDEKQKKEKKTRESDSYRAEKKKKIEDSRAKRPTARAYFGEKLDLAARALGAVKEEGKKAGEVIVVNRFKDVFDGVRLSTIAVAGVGIDLNAGIGNGVDRSLNSIAGRLDSKQIIGGTEKLLEPDRRAVDAVKLLKDVAEDYRKTGQSIANQVKAMDRTGEMYSGAKTGSAEAEMAFAEFTAATSLKEASEEQLDELRKILEANKIDTSKGIKNVLDVLNELLGDLEQKIQGLTDRALEVAKENKEDSTRWSGVRNFFRKGIGRSAD